MREFKRFERMVLIGERSVRFLREPSYNPPKAKIEKRGDITSFSRHSALRLRDALSQLHVDGASVYGVCLTVPWQLSDFKDHSGLFQNGVSWPELFDKYKASFNRFGVSFRRTFPNSACIFRHELQTRKMPHCHLVCYFSSVDLPAASDVLTSNLPSWIRQRIVDLWGSALLYDFGSGSVSGFFRSGCHVQKLDDLPSMFRYIGDHTSKHKQAQLGYQGKQWGYLNRKLLVSRSFTRFDFESSRDLVLFQRNVTKLCRFVIHKRKGHLGDVVSIDNPFGSKLSSRRRLVSIQFLDQNTSYKIFDWLQDYKRSCRAYRMHVRSDRHLIYLINKYLASLV